jgi:hypothetical protein
MDEVILVIGEHHPVRKALCARLEMTLGISSSLRSVSLEMTWLSRHENRL